MEKNFAAFLHLRQLAGEGAAVNAQISGHAGGPYELTPYRNTYDNKV